MLELAETLTPRAERVENVNDIKHEWLDGVKSVGITSAASTPDDLVQEMVEFFKRKNSSLTVIEEGEPEDIEFRMPERVPASA